MPLVVNLRALRANFTLAGPDVEPAGDRWRGASDAERLDYFTMLARRVLAVKRDQLLNGVDATGAPLRPALRISREAYRQAGLPSAGPALLPQAEASRTYRYLAVEPFPRQRPNRVVGFWRAGWQQVLHFHATATAGRGHPYRDDAGRLHWAGIPGATSGIIRDVVGMPRPYFVRAVAAAKREWTRKYGATPVPAPTAKPKPKPRPKVKPIPPDLVPPADPGDVSALLAGLGAATARGTAEVVARHGGRVAVADRPVLEAVADYRAAKADAVRREVLDRWAELDRLVAEAGRNQGRAYREQVEMPASAKATPEGRGRLETLRRYYAAWGARRLALERAKVAVAHEAIRPAPGRPTATVAPRPGPGVTPEMRDRAAAAAAWLADRMAAGNAARPTVAPLPPKGRAFRRSGGGPGRDGSIHHAPDDPVRTYVHELGHEVEEVGGHLAMSEAFRRERIARAGRPDVPMSDFGEGFRAGETGNEADFGRAFGGDRNRAAYAGKDYGGGGTEIVSMGLEELYTRPENLLDDPEYFAFILAVMHREIRPR